MLQFATLGCSLSEHCSRLQRSPYVGTSVSKNTCDRQRDQSLQFSSAQNGLRLHGRLELRQTRKKYGGFPALPPADPLVSQGKPLGSSAPKRHGTGKTCTKTVGSDAFASVSRSTIAQPRIRPVDRKVSRCDAPHSVGRLNPPPHPSNQPQQVLAQNQAARHAAGVPAREPSRVRHPGGATVHPNRREPCPDQRAQRPRPGDRSDELPRCR